MTLLAAALLLLLLLCGRALSLQAWSIQKATTTILKLNCVSGQVVDLYEEDAGDADRAAREEDKMSLTSPRIAFSEVLPRSVGRLVEEMLVEGVAKIAGALSQEQVGELLLSVNAQLSDSLLAAPDMSARNLLFANSKSQDNRWDLKLTCNGIIDGAMRTLLARGSLLGDSLHALVGDRARVVELAAFITIEGAGRQIVHSDTAWSKLASLYTCTIALQDVDELMGPTVFIPKTHSAEAYLERMTEFMSAEYMSEDESALLSRPHMLSVLLSGSAALYDSRLLHCGGANRSQRPRVLFYFTVSNPDHDDESTDGEEEEEEALAAGISRFDKSIRKENMGLTLGHFRSLQAAV